MTLTAVPGLTVGHAQVPGGGSGCTVVLGPFRGVVEIRGMATGTRELDALAPHHLVTWVDGLLLTGGSAFGLAAADGVVEWLAERGRGFDAGAARVPIVPGAVIFDLEEGVARPGPQEGRRAADEASGDPVAEGRVGAGTGATVGKLLGPASASPGGLASVSARWREGTVGALAVVNALGDVLAADGSILAGPRGPDDALLSSDVLARSGEVDGGSGNQGFPGTNTTLVVVATDLPLGRLDLGKIARMATSGLSRTISPVNTPFDGDMVFVLSSGEEKTSMPPGDLVALGVLARDLTEGAIRRAVIGVGEGGAEDRPGGRVT